MRAPLPRRAYLGAELPDDRVAFSDGGMRVSGVLPDTMAARAGMAAGDVVQSIAGLPVASLAELAAALRAAGRQTTTTIEYVRAGGSCRAEVSVEQAPATGELGDLDVGGARLRTLRTRARSPRA